MRSLALLPLLAAALLLAACGSETPAAAPSGTDLMVRVDADGDGGQPANSVRVRCPGDHCKAAQSLKQSDFAPTPAGIACSMIYGGPETATVTGTLRGKPIDAKFSRTDGCQTSRWRKVQKLLAAAR